MLVSLVDMSSKSAITKIRSSSKFCENRLGGRNPMPWLKEWFYYKLALCCTSDNRHERENSETLQFAANLIGKARENQARFGPCAFAGGFFLYMALSYHHSVQEQGLGVCLKCSDRTVWFFVMFFFPNRAEPEVFCPFLNRKGQKWMTL